MAIYSSNNNVSYSENIFQLYFSDLKKTAIQAQYKKLKKVKGNVVTKPVNKILKVAPNLPTTHLFRL